MIVQDIRVVCNTVWTIIDQSDDVFYRSSRRCILQLKQTMYSIDQADDVLYRSSRRCILQIKQTIYSIDQPDDVFYRSTSRCILQTSSVVFDRIITMTSVNSDLSRFKLDYLIQQTNVERYSINGNCYILFIQIYKRICSLVLNIAQYNRSIIGLYV